MINTEQLAGVLYNEYCRNVGGKAFNDDPLPAWPEFRADPKKKVQSEAWVKTAQMAQSLLLPLEDKIALIAEQAGAEKSMVADALLMQSYELNTSLEELVQQQYLTALELSRKTGAEPPNSLATASEKGTLDQS